VALEDPERRLWRLQGVLDRITLHAASLEPLPSLYPVVAEVRPAECYHLAAPSFVSYSFEDETASVTTSIAGTTFLLSALRGLAPECRFYFAGSSEMFGNPLESPQSEGTSLLASPGFWRSVRDLLQRWSGAWTRPTAGSG
jgi:GDPmannose 4,6-dehydratase